MANFILKTLHKTVQKGTHPYAYRYIIRQHVLTIQLQSIGSSEKNDEETFHWSKAIYILDQISRPSVTIAISLYAIVRPRKGFYVLYGFTLTKTEMTIFWNDKLVLKERIDTMLNGNIIQVMTFHFGVFLQMELSCRGYYIDCSF